jgi:tRNA pseudouridine38-40 synthase
VPRIRLDIAYDGTDFSGFARQPGLRTVRGTLEEALEATGVQADVWGASRTDAGAHAEGQVCHFDTENPMPADRWARVLNDLLALDVRVLRSRSVGPDFDSRFCAIDRHYRYRLLCGAPDPFRGRFAYATHRSLDLDAMARAARSLQGRHDFRAFTEELDPGVDNTVRDLFSVSVRAVRDEIWFEVVGTAFLRGMMRRMAGAIFEVGRGARDPASIARLLAGEAVTLPVVLPARGLTLVRVRYGRHPRDHRS